MLTARIINSAVISNPRTSVFMLRPFSCFASAFNYRFFLHDQLEDGMVLHGCYGEIQCWPLHAVPLEWTKIHCDRWTVTCKLSGERLFEKNLDLAPGPGSRSLRHQKSQCLSKERLLWIAFGGPCAWIRPYPSEHEGHCVFEKMQKGRVTRWGDLFSMHLLTFRHYLQFLSGIPSKLFTYGYFGNII